MKILITGSEGLIGSFLKKHLRQQGIDVVGIDLKSKDESEFGDVRDIARLRQKTSGCSGIIHLAAISRVVHAQNDPIKCWETNVRGTSHLLREALSFSKKPNGPFQKTVLDSCRILEIEAIVSVPISRIISSSST